MAMTRHNETMLCAAGLALIAVTGVLLAPGGLLAGLVGLSGLPTLLPAAAPPLGMTARLLIAAAAAVSVGFGFVLLLHLLNRVRRARRRPGVAAASATFRPVPDPVVAGPGAAALLARLEAGLARLGGRPPAVTAELADAVRRISRG
ncbi:hypothetical protein ACMT1E_07515 [Sphingomonas flavalba]|uniref:hypothetical protein n=1 Tax=Sphingomonas flavalba TaxID=2559804 RepID=UPI0039E0BF20